MFIDNKQKCAYTLPMQVRFGAGNELLKDKGEN